MQLKFFQAQTRYQLIETQIVFHSNKNHSHNIQQNKVYYADQVKKYRIRKDKEVDRNLTFQECAPIVLSLLVEKYNGSI